MYVCMLIMCMYVCMYRYGCNLIISPAATLTWQQGNIALADGANITIQGAMLVNNYGFGRVYVGR